jgi:NAD-dependent deacetylase
MGGEEGLYLDAFLELLGGAGEVLAFTGAGVSEESGIPTFRGSGGLWEKYPPTVYGNLPGLAAAFLFRPRRLSGFAADVLRTILEARPNPCHTALALLEEKGILRGVVTQNIDDLHSLAGNKEVMELHGNAFRLRCRACGLCRKVDREDLSTLLRRLEEGGMKRRTMLRLLRDYLVPCPECGGGTRPGVVFFGEALPPGVLDRAVEAASRCDVLLVLGTSALVYPAALVPRAALDAGARLVEVNPEPTGLTPFVDLHVPLPAGRFFSLYLEREG